MAPLYPPADRMNLSVDEIEDDSWIVDTLAIVSWKCTFFLRESQPGKMVMTLHPHSHSHGSRAAE